jgi:hypothetical protein
MRLRQFHARAIDLGDIILQAVFGQFKTICSEGIRNDQFRACFDVFAVDLGDGGGIGQVQLVEAFVEADSARVKHGSHCAVGEDGFTVKGFEQVHGFFFQV